VYEDMLPGERVRLHAAADTAQEAHATAAGSAPSRWPTRPPPFLSPARRTQPALSVLEGAP